MPGLLSETTYQIIIGSFLTVVLIIIGFLIGRLAVRKKYERTAKKNMDTMKTIERSLKEFWDNEKIKLQNEKQELQKKIDFLEEKLEQYRKKAAGVGVMGLGKGKRTDMLLSLLMENEALEEKLFMQNLKLKEERDDYLQQELRNISYKRIFLSEIVSQDPIRQEIEKFLRDNSNLKKLDVKSVLDATEASADETEESEEQ